MPTYPAITPIVDNSTLETVDRIIRVKDGGITPTKLSFATMERISQITDSAISSISFSSIPTVYSFFVIKALFWLWSGTQTEHMIGIRFNDDSGTNYEYQTLKASGSSVSSSLTTSTTYIPVGSFYSFGVMDITIANITNYHKLVIGTHSNMYTNTNNLYVISGRWWNTTSKITKITLFNATNSDTFFTKTILFGVRE
jgi:hypothetical protein